MNKTKSKKNNLNVLTYGLDVYRFPYNLLHFFPQIMRNIKYAYQRIVRGYCDADCWSLDVYYSNLMIETLRHLALNHTGYPTATDEEWVNVLNVIAQHLENSLEDTETEMNRKTWQAYAKMNSYIIERKAEKTEDGCWRSVETYSDEKAYKEAQHKWLETEDELRKYRITEKNQALEMLKIWWMQLWD